MSLVIATGSNLGNKELSLKRAKDLLSEHFTFIAESSIYKSAAVDYLNQPDFFNQTLEFELPKKISPNQAMLLILELESELGRLRDIPKGPRTIDIDIIFWGTKTYSTDLVSIPHPSWQERSFVVLPLHELPFYQSLQKSFIIPTEFNNYAEKI